MRSQAAALFIILSGLLVFVLQSKTGNVPLQSLILSGSTDCKFPCIWGIIPGTTSYWQAVDTLNSLIPSDQRISEAEFWVEHSTDKTPIFVEIRRDPLSGDIVRQIDLSTHSQGIITTLGELIESGFIPTRVFRNRINGPNTINLLVVFDNHQIVAQVVATEHLNPDSPVHNLYLLSDEPSSWMIEDIRTILHFDDEIRWLGFAPIEDYLTTE